MQAATMQAATMHAHDRMAMTATMQVDREPSERHFDRSTSTSRADSADSADSASTSASTHAAPEESRAVASKTSDNPVGGRQLLAQGPLDRHRRRRHRRHSPLASPELGNVPRAHLVAALASVLGHMAELGRRSQMTFSFHASRIPALSVHDYLTRLAAFYGCSDQCLVLTLVYVDRIVKKHPEFVVSPWSIHRLLMTGMMVATKFWDDTFYSNKHYAKVGGVRLQEINRLEMHFLLLIGWRLQVLPQEYNMYQSQVILSAQHVFNSEVQVPTLAPSFDAQDAQAEDAQAEDAQAIKGS